MVRRRVEPLPGGATASRTAARRHYRGWGGDSRHQPPLLLLAAARLAKRRRCGAGGRCRRVLPALPVRFGRPAGCAPALPAGAARLWLGRGAGRGPAVGHFPLPRLDVARAAQLQPAGAAEPVLGVWVVSLYAGPARWGAGSAARALAGIVGRGWAAGGVHPLLWLLCPGLRRAEPAAGPGVAALAAAVVAAGPGRAGRPGLAAGPAHRPGTFPRRAAGGFCPAAALGGAAPGAGCLCRGHQPQPGAPGRAHAAGAGRLCCRVGPGHLAAALGGAVADGRLPGRAPGHLAAVVAGEPAVQRAAPRTHRLAPLPAAGRGGGGRLARPGALAGLGAGIAAAAKPGPMALRAVS